jgi:CheY-like chemotaxis protein
MLINKKGIKSVHFAEDGKIALDMLQSLGINHIDMIFLDNTMPNMVR